MHLFRGPSKGHAIKEKLERKIEEQKAQNPLIGWPAFQQLCCNNIPVLNTYFEDELA